MLSIDLCFLTGRKQAGRRLQSGLQRRWETPKSRFANVRHRMPLPDPLHPTALRKTDATHFPLHNQYLVELKHVIQLVIQHNAIGLHPAMCSERTKSNTEIDCPCESAEVQKPEKSYAPKQARILERHEIRRQRREGLRNGHCIAVRLDEMRIRRRLRAPQALKRCVEIRAMDQLSCILKRAQKTWHPPDRS